MKSPLQRIKQQIGAIDSVARGMIAALTRNFVYFSAATTAVLADYPSTASLVYLKQDGREGQFKWTSGNQSAKVTADPLQGVVVAPTSDTTGASGAWIRVHDGILNVKWFGAVADDNGTVGTDNLAAFVGAVAWSKSLKQSIGYANAGPSIKFPFGRYYASDTTYITHQLSLLGDGTGLAGGWGTLIRVPGNKKVFDLSDATDGTIIKGFALFGLSGADNILYPAIETRSRILASDLFIANFAGDGIYINGVDGNSNCWIVERCRIQDCRNGVFVDGADGNAGWAWALDVSGNRNYGFWDSSFLGNEWHTHGEGNTLGNYLVDGLNARCNVTAYTEPGVPVSDLGVQGIGYGPQFAGTTKGAYLSAANLDGGGLSSTTGFYTRADDYASASSHIMRTRVAWGGTNDGGLGGGNVLTGNYSTDGTNYINTVDIKLYGNRATIGTNAQITFSAGANYANSAYGRTNPVPFATRIAQAWIGDNTQARLRDTKNAVPTSGEFARGDIIWSNIPVIGGYTGWICTSAGAIATAAWAGSTAYNKSDLVTNDGGKTYVCATAGTSASSGGPTGTGSGIADGTVVWEYKAAFTLAEFGVSKLQSSATYDPGNLVDGDGATTTVTVTGAAFGDFAQASFSLDTQGITVTAWVSAANTVSVRFQNETGDAIDLGSGTLLARVVKQ